MNEETINKFETILTKCIYADMWFIVLATIVLLIGIIWVSKIGALKEPSIIIPIIICFCLVLALYFIYVLPCQLDINNQSYEEYVGEFYVEEYGARGKGVYIFIKKPEDKKSIRYRAPGHIIIETDTSYIGSFIIAKHSRTLVDIKDNNKTIYFYHNSVK